MLIQNKNKIIGFLAILLMTVSYLFPQSSGEDFYENLNYKEKITKKGTSAAPFLEIGIGARAQALGGAFTAVANDASALYWNPAGLTQLSNFALIANHTDWLANTNLEYVGIVLPAGYNVRFGLQMTYLDYIDNQPVRTIENPEGTGEFYSASDMSMAATMALKITDRFSFGVNGKYIRQEIWHESATAFALDLGVLYRSSLEGLTIGTSISNFGTELQLTGRDLVRAYDADDANYSNDQLNINLETGKFPLPLLFRFGLAYQFDIGQFQNVLISTDINHPSNNVESINIGVEYTLMEYLTLQAGYQSLFDDESENGYTFGFGVRPPIRGLSDISFNYGYSNWGILGDVQRFSLQFGR